MTRACRERVADWVLGSFLPRLSHARLVKAKFHFRKGPKRASARRDSHGAVRAAGLRLTLLCSVVPLE